MKTYYSWECPPRKLVDGVLDFDVDLDEIFVGKKLDKFTELPKVIEFKEIEKDFVGDNYYKIIADTNLLILSQESKKVSFKLFKEKLQAESDKLYGKGKVKVVLFSELIDFEEYNKLFFSFFESFWDLVSLQDFFLIKKYLREHVGLDNSLKTDEFCKKVIVSYIVEGILIPKVFDSPVWINFDEPEVLANMSNKICNKIEIVGGKNGG